MKTNMGQFSVVKNFKALFQEMTVDRNLIYVQNLNWYIIEHPKLNILFH